MHWRGARWVPKGGVEECTQGEAGLWARFAYVHTHAQIHTQTHMYPLHLCIKLLG